MKTRVFAFLFLLSFSFFSLISTNTASGLDTSGWFIYKGSVGGHDFSFLFPQNYEVISGTGTQKLVKKDSDTAILIVDEFANQDFQEVKKAYQDRGYSILDEADQILETDGEPLFTRNLSVKMGEDKSEITLVKRSKATLAIVNPYVSTDIAKAIIQSLDFNDSYHQYLDFKGQYAFVFHNQFTPNSTSTGVKLTIGDKKILTVTQYAGESLDSTLDILEDQSWETDSRDALTINSEFKTQEVVLRNKSTNKRETHIFFEIAGNTYQIGNTNQADYQSEIDNILNSFYFFNLSGTSSSFVPYQFFPDVNDEHPNRQAINKLKNEEIIDGYPNGNYKPDSGINRAEITKLVIAATTDEEDLEGYEDCFDDVDDQWFAKYVCYAKEKGYVEGYKSGDFKPGNKVNRAEALKIIQEVLYHGRISPKTALDPKVVDIDEDDWFIDYYRLADENNSLDLQHIEKSGTGFKYLPGGNMSRKEVAEMIYRIKY